MTLAYHYRAVFWVGMAIIIGAIHFNLIVAILYAAMFLAVMVAAYRIMTPSRNQKHHSP